MITHYTQTQPVKGKVSIWAIPKQEWIDNKFVFTNGWNYRLSTSGLHLSGAVCVCTNEISLPLPGGINLAEKAIETLETAKKDELKEHLERQLVLDNMIGNLRQITHNPIQDNVIESEAVAISDDDVPF